MPLPPDFDLRSFLERIDRHPDLKGSRVVYFDGQKITVLREGPLWCAADLKTVVIRNGVEETVLKSEVAARTRDGKFFSELLGAGLSCSAAALGWMVVAGSAGAAPITGGASTFISLLAYGAAGASSIQCINSLARVTLEVKAPESNDWLDSQSWYTQTATALDVLSLAGAAASGAATIRMVAVLRRTTGKGMLDVLKGLSRQERRRLAEEIVRTENRGISNTQVKTMIRAGLYPKRYTGLQVSQSVKVQLKDALGAALSFSGSALSGVARQTGSYAIGLAQSVDTY